MTTTITTRWQFSVDEFHRIREAQILTEDNRVELLDGEIIAMSPVGSFHASTHKSQKLFVAR